MHITFSMPQTTSDQKEVIENVKKCKNFLSTLLKLASNQPIDTLNRVMKLIQGLIVSTLHLFPWHLMLCFIFVSVISSTLKEFLDKQGFNMAVFSLRQIQMARAGRKKLQQKTRDRKMDQKRRCQKNFHNISHVQSVAETVRRGLDCAAT